MVAYLFKVAIATTIAYIIVCYIQVVQFSGGKEPYKLNSDKLYAPTDETKMNCKYSPRRCYNCDCRVLCDGKKAFLMDFKDDKYFNLPDGTYCYEAPESLCKREYADWIFEYNTNTWNCIRKYPGVFTATGQNVAGYYPLTNEIGKGAFANKTDLMNITCGEDEHGNYMLFFNKNGISTCVKDYCKNNMKMPHEIGHYNLKLNKCICAHRGIQDIFKDETLHCLMENIEPPSFQNGIALPIFCYNENTFLTDLDNKLCYDEIAHKQKKGKIIIKNEQDIGLV